MGGTALPRKGGVVERRRRRYLVRAVGFEPSYRTNTTPRYLPVPARPTRAARPKGIYPQDEASVAAKRRRRAAELVCNSCGRWDSNPQRDEIPPDPKSGAYASSATPALGHSVSTPWNLQCSHGWPTG